MQKRVYDIEDAHPESMTGKARDLVDARRERDEWKNAYETANRNWGIAAVERDEAVANYNVLLDAQIVEIKLRQAAEAKLQRARVVIEVVIDQDQPWDIRRTKERLEDLLADLDEGGDGDAGSSGGRA